MNIVNQNYGVALKKLKHLRLKLVTIFSKQIQKS